MLPDAGTTHQTSATHTVAAFAMQPPFVLVDPGILPLVVHLDLANAYRIYLIASWLNVNYFNGRGWLTYVELKAGLREFGVEYTKINYILKKGEGIFWKQRKTRIRLIAHALKLPEKLGSRVHPDILAACRPSKLQVWVDVSGTMESFEARLYAAWIDNRNPSGKIQASRAFLTKVWNRGKLTLLKWEKIANVRVTPTYAQYGGENPNLVPDHAFVYAAKDYNGNKVTRAGWQYTNIYSAGTPTKEHHSGGQQRKARKSHKQALKNNQPPEKKGGGLADTGRLVFENKRDVLAPKRIRRHLRQHQDLQTRHYFHLGMKRTRKGNIVIMECYDNDTDIAHTNLHERDYHAEYSGAFCKTRFAFYEYGFTVLLNRKPDRKKTEHTKRVDLSNTLHVDPLVAVAVEMGGVVSSAVVSPECIPNSVPYRTFASVLKEVESILRCFCSLSQKLRKKANYRALWREIYALPDVAALDARKAELQGCIAILEAKKARRERFLKWRCQTRK